MRTLLRIAALATGVGLVTGPIGAGRAPFTLAVLRQDGILIPFASFDGRWRTTWPTPGSRIDVPITLDDIPLRWWPDERPRVDWTLWLPDGRSRPLRAVSPAWFVAQCQANVGLKTDYAAEGPLPDPEAIPFPKDGLAVTGPQEIRPSVDPIVVLHDSDEDWSLVSDRLAAPFDGAEASAVRRAADAGWRHPVAPDDRRRRPIALEALYRATDRSAGTSMYYFEAVRRYEGVELPRRDQERPPCDVLTFAWGWVRRAPAGPPDVFVGAVVSDCYRSNVAFLLPFGVLRLTGSPPLWVVQVSTWSGEAYLVVEPRPPERERTLIETGGGTCR